ncbi:MAG: hypothetical protein LC795_12960 [Acidobacteria bacterium]|nr:hypothetical protein [Acidobacteriota bacterium]
MGKKIFVTVLLLLAALTCAAPSARARQGGAPADAEVEQVRSNIRLLEQETPPAGLESQHRASLAALRLSLRDKLMAQKAAMEAYLGRVRAALPAEQVRGIEAAIRDKDGQIAEAAAALIASAANAPATQPQPQPTQPQPRPTQPPQPPQPELVQPQPRPAAGGPDLAALALAGEEPLKTPELAAGAVASGGLAAQGAGLVGRCAEVNSFGANFSTYEKAVCRIVDELQKAKAGRVLADGDVIPPIPNATVNFGRHFTELQTITAAKLIGREERGKFLVEAEDARTDKQVEGGPENAGSTSLVVKGGAPTVLGFAVSNGALVQSQSGTTFTFRGNPVGLVKLLQNKTFDESYLEDVNDPATRLLKKTSFSVSFDADRGDEPGVFTAGKQQLSAWSVRYEFVNERDPRHRKHDKAFATFLAEEGNNLALSIFGSYQTMLVGKPGELDRRYKDPALQAWFAETEGRLAAAAAGDVEAILKEQLDKFPTGDKLLTETRDAVGGFANNFSGYLAARRKLLDEIAKGKVITFEYTNNREVNAPDTSNFRFIAETGVFGGKADLTGNASFTVHNARPAGGAGRVRDFQFAGQLDMPFKVERVGNFVFSFAGKYERLTGDATALDGTVLPGTKGDIAVGQLKLEVPFIGGMRLPLSLTFANRTELVRESEVRGNFGFTFDMDKILARFKPF